MSFSYPFHVLVMSFFFPFMSFKLQEIPKSKNYTSFLLNHQLEKYLDGSSSQSGTGIPHKSPKKQISKGSRESFSCFFRRGCPHFISLHVHSVPFVSCFPFLFHVLSWSEVGRFPKSTHNRSFPFLTFYLKRTRQKQSQHQLTWARGEPHRSPKVMRNQ